MEWVIFAARTNHNIVLVIAMTKLLYSEISGRTPKIPFQARRLIPVGIRKV